MYRKHFNEINWDEPDISFWLCSVEKFSVVSWIASRLFTQRYRFVDLARFGGVFGIIYL